ncbi:class I SAM-dependent methyltransferase [Cytobacillus purgationiresistens]|uniref:Ubiquinone/menaquinone biosynthesis C-methylase UbiE n=1 Tax=Cytobacillus purgationiresistens TaxID=863449 RepID=A0ABU0AM11_9BACI|nr:class I SAM-dependent methyltransferase [Cytobacillus purgationiresistens]MDQ0272306.1 ubiquinone/menaquinone biosynthesis C-methylase UbiE [Cytobacillus purgationiresistens]
MGYSYEDALAYYGIGAAHPGGIKLTKEIFSKEKISSQSKLLDAGCGAGETSILLGELFGCDIEAIDQHPEMVRITEAKAKHAGHSITVREGNIENLPFEGKTFDYIISESVTAFTNIDKTLSEFSRVLTDDGALFLIEMTKESPFSTEEEQDFLEFYHMEAMLTEKDWKSALSAAGFQTVEVIKSNTVINEINQQLPQESEQQTPYTLKGNEEINEILEDHYVLTYQYGDKLGYRVFRAMKNSQD